MTINRDRYRQWAIRYGFGVIEENAEVTFDGLDMKKASFGVAYCPCISPMAHSNEMICPCVPTKNRQGIGECHCGLFKWE